MTTMSASLILGSAPPENQEKQQRDKATGKQPLHPFFDSQRRNELKNLPAKTKKARPATRDSPPDGGREAKPKKTRQRAGTKTQKPRGRKEPDPAAGYIDPGRSKSIDESSHWAAAGVTRSSTLLTPSSSPRLTGVVGGDDVDLNHDRRKRRKKTPVSSGTEQDVETELSMFETPPSGQRQPALATNAANPRSGRPLTSYKDGVFTIRTSNLGLALAPYERGTPSAPLRTAPLLRKAKRKVKKGPAPLLQENPEAVLRGKQAVNQNKGTEVANTLNSLAESPSTLPAPVKTSKPRKKKHNLTNPLLPLLTEAAERKKKITYDPESGMLTIPSSPIIMPESSPMPPVDAFSLRENKKNKKPSVALAPATKDAKSLPLPAVTIREVPKITAGTQSQKPLHPFFQPGGVKKVPALPLSASAGATGTEGENSTTSSISSERPAKLRRDSYPFGGATASSISARDDSIYTFSLGQTRNRTLKTPGLVDAPWPLRDSCHVRGFSRDEMPDLRMGEGPIRMERKLKDVTIAISPEENILRKYESELSINAQKEDILSPDYDERRFYDVPPDVRLPKRIVTTGSTLQETMRGRISARLPHPENTNTKMKRSRSASVSSTGSAELTRRRTHPALTTLYNRLGKELTAFDRNECESQAWEVKYAPNSSAELLQVGKEPQILKDWLMALKVESVDTGSSVKNTKGKRKSRSNSNGSAGKGAVIKKRRKRKKDDDELAGFVIDSEDERNEMGEITDPEGTDNSATPGVKKSTIRSGDRGIDFPFGGLKEPARLVNAVVISGPNGCGKTAAVYAVAKEVGFTVFEVSPGTRRSGKDILDLVGEMTRTHLVHQAKADDSGKVASFFKNKQTKQAQAQDAQRKGAQQQQQSLILLEEVDLLFEEDKQFWSTVLTLMAQSKRPIVMTCNDEGLLPLDILPLHAILRLTPPPLDLATDHLLLICANEGHLLQREAVTSLVKSVNNDLRASLMELEFWCRMGVGDRKGGLDWMLVRWPVGSDISKDGEVQRVVSRNTYRKGISWVQRGTKDEDKWRDVWEKWGVDVGDGKDIGLVQSAEGLRKGLEGLSAWDEYAESMSSVDVSAGVGMNGDEPVLDTTHPVISARNRIDDIMGYKILQTNPATMLQSTETDISVCVRTMARTRLGQKMGIYSRPLGAVGDKEIFSMVVDRIQTTNGLKPLSETYIRETFQSLASSSSNFSGTPSIAHSVVNRPREVLLTDVAPYVRSIFRYDLAREEVRKKLGGLLSQGGGKKRVTRAARVAEEGGSRGRKERWFGALNAKLVVGSGGEGWNVQNEETKPQTEESGDNHGDDEQY